MKQILELNPYEVSTICIALEVYADLIDINILVMEDNVDIQYIYINQRKDLVELVNKIRNSKEYNYEV